MDKQLDFGASFSRVFDLYGKHAAPLLIWAAVVQFGIALLVAVVITIALSGGSLGTGLALGAVAIAFAVIASSVLTGAYLVGLDEAERTGTFPAFGEVWSRVSPRIGPLIITSILAAIGIGFGFLLLIVPGLVLMTWWAVFAPVVVLEGQTGFDALGRSRELVRGNAWTVFGLVVVIGILTSIGSSIIGSIVGAILGGDDTFLGIFGSEFVSGTLLTPISALLAVVIYLALSGRGDGDDAGTPPIEAPRADPTRPTDGGTGPFV